MNKATVDSLIERHAEMLEHSAHFSKDNPTKVAYYGLLNQIIGQVFFGWSGRRYIAFGVGYHRDESGQFRPSHCPGYLNTETGLVHLDNIDWGYTQEHKRCLIVKELNP